MTTKQFYFVEKSSVIRPLNKIKKFLPELIFLFFNKELIYFFAFLLFERCHKFQFEYLISKLKWFHVSWITNYFYLRNKCSSGFLVRNIINYFSWGLWILIIKQYKLLCFHRSTKSHKLNRNTHKKSFKNSLVKNV